MAPRPIPAKPVNADHFEDTDHDDYTSMEDKDPKLVELERQLNEEVDEDFFEEPRKFNTLARVIDVLGMQISHGSSHGEHHHHHHHGPQTQADLAKNPAYQAMKKQQQIVEGAIEHMAVIHCGDLNGSVFQVGRVARQFNEAVSRVRSLRKQVRDIQETLGSHQQTSNEDAPSANSVKGGTPGKKMGAQNAAAMSLREMWLKKLECEATLALLEKLDIIRAAPTRFDQLVQPPCRIGAAVLTVSQALQTMFSDDVAQVQALHKIMEQLLLRKQKSEEILWDTLHEVIYLRTGNGLATRTATQGMTIAGQKAKTSAALRENSSVSKGDAHSVISSESKSRHSRSYHRSSSGHTINNAAAGGSAGASSGTVGRVNPFVGPRTRFAVDRDWNQEEDDVDSVGSGASLFSVEDYEEDEGSSINAGSKSAASTTSQPGAFSLGASKRTTMIPIPIIDAELDLEEDERRCVEEIALSNMAIKSASRNSNSVPTVSAGSHRKQRQLPRYADPVLALRILVESLTHLKRLDDTERILNEGLEREIRHIVQREQSRTFSRLERKRRSQTIRSSLQKPDASLTEFRRHLTRLLSSFGSVLLRLSHLSQILRFRISSDKELMQSVGSHSTIMRPVITFAMELMESVIREFLQACLYETSEPRNEVLQSTVRKGGMAYESGLFSLGIIEHEPSKQIVSTATRSNVLEMSVSKFVATVLFPKTRNEPQVRHALVFRRMIARYTSQVEAMNKELAAITNEDMSSGSFRAVAEQSAISYLDKVIQNDLLPAMQEEAVNGTVQGLERRDAFDPVLDRTLYTQPRSNEPDDVDMCIACQIMYNSTGPLFMALHRLPRDGEMYMPLVAVLEHVILTFISRVKKQVGQICNDKTALTLLMQEGQQSGSFANVMERRKPYQLLRQAYHANMELETSTAVGGSRSGGILPLTPSPSDTAPNNASALNTEEHVDDVAEGVEGEEIALEQELAYVNTYMDFASDDFSSRINVCSDEQLMKASCLAHSLLELAVLLERRLKIRGGNKTLSSTRALREAIKTIQASGIKMAKFCRLDMLMQVISRMAKVCLSSTLVARDAVRIPSSVNDLGEYLTAASDNLREAAGNAITAYTLSSLEQYIPVCLMQTVRVVAAGKGVISKHPLTMNGIEALDRSGSVLYRDLKGATAFDNSFWDVELAAVSFESSASYIAMMELEMEELVAYYTANRDDFSEEDFELMFGMTGPRRRGDVGRYHMTRKQLKLE